MDPDQYLGESLLEQIEKEAESEGERESDLKVAARGPLLYWMRRLEANMREPVWLRTNWRLIRPDESIEADVASSWREALRLSAHGRWRRAAEVFAGLIERLPENPALWWNKGLCLARYGRLEEAAEWVRRYAERVEDEAAAVDIEAFAISLIEAANPSMITCNRYSYRIASRTRLVERLASAPSVQKMQEPDGSHRWVLVGQPLQQGQPVGSETGDGSQLYFAIAAIRMVNDRVEIVPTVDESEEARRQFLAIVGDAIDVGSERSESFQQLTLRARFEQPLFGACTEEILIQRREIVQRYRARYEQHWAETRFNCLDGKTPREAYEEAQLRRRVRAALWLVEQRFFAMGSEPPALREQFGIDPEPSWELDGHNLKEVPPSRLPYLRLD
ncbi:MAG TPA: tetratricopeptide repeat protein, partial [Planctomycetaceae bacterium]|nr:tetratricopeptide repeat protein [Planctomycetaceae bacterium]